MRMIWCYTCNYGNCYSDTLGGMSCICWTYAALNKSQGQFSTKVRLRNENLSFVEIFRYIGHIMTADCRGDKDIKKQFRKQNAVGNMLVRKFSFAPIDVKIQLFKSYCYPIYGCALWRHAIQSSIRKRVLLYYYYY